MAKYTFTIELDENRTSCLGCPLCNSDDYCALQDDEFNYLYNDTWDAMLSNCPLRKVESEASNE